MSSSSPSHSNDLGVVTPRRHTLEDKETSSSDVGNSNGDLFVGTEGDGPMDLSISGQTESSSSDAGISNGDFVVDTEDDGPMDLSISGHKEDEKLRRREVPFFATLELPEEESTTVEEEEPIRYLVLVFR